MGIAENLKRLRKEARLSQPALARASGVSQQLISQIERGENVSTTRLPDLARALHVGPDDLDESFAGLDGQDTVPLVGFVGAAGADAAAVHYYGDSPGELDRVRAPKNATKQTVAVEIRGESMGQLLNRWLVYYDEVRSPVTDDLIGIPCVVGLADERVLVKRIKSTRTQGLYDLESNTGEAPIRSVAITWAAAVRSIEPR